MTDEMINIIVSNLRYFSFASITIAFMVGTYKGREVKLTERIIFTTFLVALLAFYSQGIDEGCKLFAALTKESDGQISFYLNKCNYLSFVEGWGSFLVTGLQVLFFKIVLASTVGLRFLAGLLQQFFIVSFKILAPVVIGLAAWDVYRGNLYKFIVFSLAAMMWSVGYLIADIFILKGIVLIGVPSALQAGAGVAVVSGGTALLGLIVFIITLFLAMCIFYILTPIIMFSVLSGANPGSAVTGNMRTAAMSSMAMGKGIEKMVKSRHEKKNPPPPPPTTCPFAGGASGGGSGSGTGAGSVSSVVSAAATKAMKGVK
jgi:hypothetical protein